MADKTQLVKKRLRIDEDGYQTLTEEQEDGETTTTTTTTTTFKRQKSYDVVEEGSDDDSEPKPTQELSSFMTTTLQQELSGAAATPASGDDDVRDSVLRHLLEASDDELGLLPTKSEETGDHESAILDPNYSIDVEGVAMEGLIDVGGGGHLWEIEDEAANYYALMQAQLFL